MLAGPTCTPGAMNAPAATQLPSWIVMGLVTRVKAGDEKSWEPVQRNARWEMQQFDSMATGARVRMTTSSPIQTWSPAEKRHGKVILTWERMTTPLPTLAPKSRNSATRNAEGQGSGV